MLADETSVTGESGGKGGLHTSNSHIYRFEFTDRSLSTVSQCRKAFLSVKQSLAWLCLNLTRVGEAERVEQAHVKHSIIKITFV